MMKFRYYRLICYVVGLIVIYLIPLGAIENHRLCLWYHLFQVDCFGCGFTRSFFCFMNGELLKAISYNKMVLFVPLGWAIVIQDSWMIMTKSNRLSLLERIFMHRARWLYPNLNIFKKLN